MSDARIKKLAGLLVNYSVEAKEGQKVLLNYDELAYPLAREVYREILRVGANPFVLVRPAWKDEDFFKFASCPQIAFVHDLEENLVADFEAEIVLCADQNTKALSRIESSKMVARSLARGKLARLHRDRAARGELRWVLCNYPTHALAQEAEMSLGEYQDFYYDVCLLDEKDPMGAYRSMQDRQNRIVELLSKVDTFIIEGPGVNLSLRTAGRIWKNSCGFYNIPDGEIFTGPWEDSANGYIKFSFPAIYRGKEVSGVELWFEGGQVVQARAQKNEEYLLSVLDTDAGARRLGEFAFGTNQQIQHFSKDILFDEKMGSSIHVALGSSYPETGGANDSVVHWDMIYDMTESIVKGDDRIIYKNGEFVL